MRCAPLSAPSFVRWPRRNFPKTFAHGYVLAVKLPQNALDPETGALPTFERFAPQNRHTGRIWFFPKDRLG